MEQNKMGVMPVGKLIINVSLPMMISMLVQALYNIVDSIFVSQINENALTAVSLAFPIQILLIAFGTGVGVGMNAILSKSLGERNTERVNAAANNGILLSAFNYIIFLLIGLFLIKPFYASQTKNVDPQIYTYGVEYLTIICTCSFGVFSQITLERLLQSTGRTIYSMITQATGAIFNIIFDPILIFGLLGFPKLGVAGAAVATVAGQIIAAILALIFNLKVNKEVTLNFKGFRPDIEMIKRIYAVGIPSTIMQAVGSVMNYFMNRILLGFGSTAAAVFGVYYKLQSFVFMPIFGLNTGLIPIIAFNYGARNRKRVMDTVKLGIVFAEAIMIAGFIFIQVFPKQLLSLFDASDTMVRMGVAALRIISTHFILAGACIIANSTFQALGNGVYSMITSLIRQLIVLLPAAYLLSLLGDLDLVWLSFPIAEIASLIVSAIFMFRIYRDIIKPLDSNAPGGDVLSL